MESSEEGVQHTKRLHQSNLNLSTVDIFPLAGVLDKVRLGGCHRSPYIHSKGAFTKPSGVGPGSLFAKESGGVLA